MDKLLLLFAVFLLGVVFLVLDLDTIPIDYFLFSDIKLPLATHVYFISEKLIVLILSYIIANEAIEYKGALWIFFGLVVVDLFDYCLTYSCVWYTVHISSFVIPVSMNTLKVTIFGLAILNEWRKKF